MTDHASLLKQIRADARPYIEQALDLAEVFTGFRKLATENGLDWGVIKALIKAKVQDEKEGGTVKVERIIEKADFATAYADMLGLGSAKMNENNFSSPPTTICEALDRAGLSLEQIDLSTGEIIEESDIGNPISTEPAVAESAPAEAGQGGEPQGRRPDEPGVRASSVAPPTIPEPASVSPSPEAVTEPEVLSPSWEGASGDLSDFPEIPAFLDRSKAA